MDHSKAKQFDLAGYLFLLNIILQKSNKYTFFYKHNAYKHNEAQYSQKNPEAGKKGLRFSVKKYQNLQTIVPFTDWKKILSKYFDLVHVQQKTIWEFWTHNMDFRNLK